MEPNDEQEHPGLTNGSSENAILSEDLLRQLSKSLPKLILEYSLDTRVTALDQLRSLHQDLLRTAAFIALSPKHGAAALNALCGLLEQLCISSNPQVRSISSEPSTWIQALDVLLRKPESNKAKPARRLLLTLTNILFNISEEERKRPLVQHVILRTTKAICTQQGVASIKPAIQTLEHFLQKDAVNALEIIEASARQATDSQAVEQTPQSPVTKGDDSHLPQAQRVASIERFVSCVLRWVIYPDCAPVVGRFLSTFFKSLEASKGKSATVLSSSQQPLWISPVMQDLKRRPSLLEVYENYVLPELLRLGASHMSAFTRTLPFEDMQTGSFGGYEVAKIQLCLVIARVVAESKLGHTMLEFPNEVDENGGNPVSEGIEKGSTICDGSTSKIAVSIDAERLGINLLEHADSKVRTSALGLLVFSSVLTRPFSQQVFDKLRVCLPLFQVEVDPKTRNEFIALMKTFCMRLRGATMHLLKSNYVASLRGNTAESCSGDTSPERGQGTIDIQQQLTWHLAFRRWYMVFLLDELRPTASYQSHITALKILHVIFDGELTGRSSLSKLNHEYFRALAEGNPRGLHLRPLSDLLLDPFDDVRQTASEILQSDLLFNSVPTFPTESDETNEVAGSEHKCRLRNDANSSLHSALCSAESRAALTGRADHADGVGKYYNLLYSSSLVLGQPIAWYECNFLIVEHLLFALEKEVSVAENDLPLAVANASLLGHIIALKYITSRHDYFGSLHASISLRLSKWQDFNKRLFFICDSVWRAVADILCFDAPEGHAVDDEEAEDTDLGPKDTLSFCWRALKESSSLLDAILTNEGYGPASPSEHGLQYHDFQQMGNLSFNQLAELRHRGAFSTVSQTFSACCAASARSSESDIADLPWNWYKRALACIQAGASSLTRRSAGIPAMITGVLAAKPTKSFFNDVILDLQAIADAPVERLGPEGARLPQVHALNCLKDVFTDARFGSSTDRYMADTMEIAVSCLESYVWAIRNCGLMLFKALLRRLNGGTDTASTKLPSSHRQSSHLVYDRYPNIPNLILRLLRDPPSAYGNSTVHAHKIFPALEIIERSGLPKSYKTEIMRSLWQHAESPNWSIREKAAKTLSCVIDERDLCEHANVILASSFWPSQNVLHGRLLCLHFLVAGAKMPISDNLLHAYEGLLPLLEASWEALVVLNPCPLTMAAYLSIQADLYTILLKSDSSAIQHAGISRLVSRVPPLESSQQTENPVLALQENALRRLLWLEYHATELATSIRTLSQARASTDQVETVLVVNGAGNDISDEEFIAILRHEPLVVLQKAAGLVRKARSKKVALLQSHDPRRIDLELAIHGHLLGTAYEPWRDWMEMDRWIRQLILAGSERSELCTRLAAARSLWEFFAETCKCDDRPKPSSGLLGVYLVLYDTLIDDDEDVRGLGARTVSSLLSAVESRPSDGCVKSLSLSPSAAKRRLLRFLEENYETSKKLWVEAVERLTGVLTSNSAKKCNRLSSRQDDSNDLDFRLRPVANLLFEAQINHYAVFVEEKQNLYIDTVREADDWATVIEKMHPDAWNPKMTAILESWTVEGLTHFLEIYENHIDGALSPISKPEVYTLWMRVILSARILIARSGPVSEKGKAKENVCRGLLEKLLKLGKQRLLHDLLLERIECILENVPHPSEEGVEGW